MAAACVSIKKKKYIAKTALEALSVSICENVPTAVSAVVVQFVNITKFGLNAKNAVVAASAFITWFEVYADFVWDQEFVFISNLNHLVANVHQWNATFVLKFCPTIL